MKNKLTKIYLLFALLCGCVQMSKAQLVHEKVPAFSIGVGYFGETLGHPGIVFFGEYALLKRKSGVYSRFNLIYYRHKHHTKNLMLLPEIVYRLHNNRYFFGEVSVGPGWLYQKADAPVFEFKQGEFKQVKSGYGYFAPLLAFRLGKSIDLNQGHQITPSFGLRGFYQYPFNDFWILKGAVDFSLSYKLK